MNCRVRATITVKTAKRRAPVTGKSPVSASRQLERAYASLGSLGKIAQTNARLGLLAPTAPQVVLVAPTVTATRSTEPASVTTATPESTVT